MLFVQQIVNGLLLGSTYALVAIGYSLIFGVLRLLNLAHGEVFMLGAFAGLLSATLMGSGPIVDLICGLVVAAVAGMAIEFTVFRPLRNRGNHHLAPITASIGISLVLQELITKMFGAEQISFPANAERQFIHLGPITITTAQIFILVVAVSSMTVLHLFISRSRYGIAMRAIAENVDVASLLGIDVDRMVLLAFALASALAGAAGVLVGLNFNAVSPFMGTEIGIKALAVMLIGGLGSIYGAMAGGLLLGVVEVMSVAYLASSYRDAFAFCLMILVLLVKPRGLFGMATR